MNRLDLTNGAAFSRPPALGRARTYFIELDPDEPSPSDREAAMELYRANREAVILELNRALSMEIVGVVRYRRQYFMVNHFAAASVTQRLLLHSNEEQLQADEILHRITQLKGEPDLGTAVDPRLAGCADTGTLADMLREDLWAERIAAAAFDVMVRAVGEDDPVTRRLLEGIRASAEEHAARMADLIGKLSRSP